MATTPEPTRMTDEQFAILRAELSRESDISATASHATRMPLMPHCPRCGKLETAQITQGGEYPLPPDTITFETCGHTFLPPIAG